MFKWTSKSYLLRRARYSAPKCANPLYILERCIWRTLMDKIVKFIKTLISVKNYISINFFGLFHRRPMCFVRSGFAHFGGLYLAHLKRWDFEVRSNIDQRKKIHTYEFFQNFSPAATFFVQWICALWSAVSRAA